MGMNPIPPDNGHNDESAHPVTHVSRTSSDPNGADFSTTLRRMRKRHRRSQDALAAEIAYDRTYVSHVENGTRRPSRTFAQRAEKVLQTGGELVALWERQWGSDSAPSSRIIAPREQLLDTFGDVQSALWGVVDEAQRYIVCAGSRSRDESYLRLIEDRLRAEPGLVYHRVLFGPPHHAALRDHLLRVLEIRDPRRTAQGAGKSVFIGIFDDKATEPEQFICANEQRAVLPLLSLNTLGHYDTALVVNDPGRAGQWTARIQEAYYAGRRIETAEDIRDLPILVGDDRDDALPA